MTKKYSAFLCFVLIVFVYGCSGRGVGILKTCSVAAYDFKQTGANEITLTFTDNGACSYKLAPDTDRAWDVYIPNAYFAVLEPSSDEFSGENISSVRRDSAGLIINFNSGFNASEKIEKHEPASKIGTKRFIFKKKENVSSLSEGKSVINAWCGSAPFSLRVDNDGVAGYDSGAIGGGKSYLDINGVRLADNFTMNESCEGVVSVSEVDYPSRVRFIINNPAFAHMNVYGNGASVFGEEIVDENAEKKGYILSVREEVNRLVQTIHVYVSGKIEPYIKDTNDNKVVVVLGKNFLSVSKVGKIVPLSGAVFAMLSISDSGGEITLSKPIDVPDINVYLEKTGYGFIIYAKKLI